ncbi:MAG: sigma-70 family RNA polymerase sigma factor [Bacteroidales bacterium]|nr:sigma-70 family RNA polymerase sigma factor [Bacteroidales bacterium]
MTDLEKIVEGCRKRNSHAQRLLYEKYAPILLGICIRYVSDRSEAEDILQDGFLKIFLNIEEYSGKGTFENWMKKIMVNTAITHYHKNFKHNQNIDISNINEGDFSILDASDKEISAKELLEIINSLPQGYKVVFNLFAIEGYKHREIAEMLNIDENTSKSQYARARKWIQNKLNILNKKNLVRV